MADTEYTPENDVWDNPEVDQTGLSPTINEAKDQAQTEAEAANISYKGAVMQSSPSGYANGDGETFMPTPITEGPALSVDSGAIDTENPGQDDVPLSPPRDFSNTPNA